MPAALGLGAGGHGERRGLPPTRASHAAPGLALNARGLRAFSPQTRDLKHGHAYTSSQLNVSKQEVEAAQMQTHMHQEEWSVSQY